MLSDSHHFRKTVAGVCMIAAPLLLLVVTVIHPEMDSDEGVLLANVADALDRWYAAHLIAFVAIVLAVPAVLGLMHMLREREVAMGHVGGGLALVGLLAFSGVVAIEFAVWRMAEAGDRAAMVALLEDIGDSAGIALPVFLVAILGFALGMVALALGLYRARAVQSWMAVCLALGAVVLMVEQFAITNWLGIVGAAIFFVGLGSIGRMVLSEPDADWEHTPEYPGFRPMAGMR
jgi:hypothetical protein